MFFPEPALITTFGILGFLASNILAIVGQSDSLIFSHVLADVCKGSSSPSIIAGMIAGITFCIIAALQFSFALRSPALSIISKTLAIISAAGFIGLSWFSTTFSSTHRIVAGIAIGAAVFFAIFARFVPNRTIFAKRQPPHPRAPEFRRFLFALWNVVLAILVLSAFALAIVFALTTANPALDTPVSNNIFFASQVVFTVAYSILFLFFYL